MKVTLTIEVGAVRTEHVMDWSDFTGMVELAQHTHKLFEYGEPRQGTTFYETRRLIERLPRHVMDHLARTVSEVNSLSRAKNIGGGA